MGLGYSMINNRNECGLIHLIKEHMMQKLTLSTYVRICDPSPKGAFSARTNITTL